MSLHFIIDGYNLIHQVSTLKKARLEDSRLALINFLKAHRPQGSLNNQLTIVFDGRLEYSYLQTASSCARVIFSQNQSADDKIKDLVEESCAPKTIVVVTSDRGIRDYVTQLGAQVKTVSEFLVKCSPDNGKDKERISLTLNEAAKITDELKGRWLKEKR